MNILIVDGMNLFIRCFVVVPTMDANGSAIGGITGFMKSLKFLVNEIEPQRVIVCWDGEGGSRRRRGIFADYKAGRKIRLNRELEAETQDESFNNMISQISKLKHLLEMVGVVHVETPSVEADDVIALLCKFVYPDDVKYVASSDNDMLQLLDKNTLVYSPSKKKYITSGDMIDVMRCVPENYIYVKALMGDASDNIKGIGGIGEKTAVKLFPFFSERPVTLDEIRSHAETNVVGSPKYRSILDKWDVLLENIKLMQLSSPLIDANSARVIRISATEQKPKFVFTEFKLSMLRYGIQKIDADFVGVFQAYKHRIERLCHGGRDNV